MCHVHHRSLTIAALNPPVSLKVGVGVGGGGAAGASPLSFFLPRPQASAESKAAAYQEVKEWFC